MKKFSITLILLSITLLGNAQDNWAFDLYFQMNTKITSDRSRDNATMSQRLDYNENTHSLSISNQIINTRGRSGNDNKNINRIIMDQQAGKIFTFMDMRDKKVRMKMPLRFMGLANPDYAGDERYRLTSFEATGNSRTIGGKNTDEYKGTTGDGVAVFVYISKRSYPNKSMAGLHRIIYNDYARKRNSNSTPIMAAMEHTLVKNKLESGHMVLGYKWTDTRHNKTVETQITDFGREFTRFDGSSYESIL